jgi:F420-dependent oxidoreductase-like protein
MGIRLAGAAALPVLLAASLCPVGGDAPAAPIEFGVQIAPEKSSYDDLVATWQMIEGLGYDNVWLNDHFMPIMGDRGAPHLEAWTLLAALATQTERIRIGVLVSGNTYRHPAVLAKMATTIDHVSRGRLNLGIGAGWEEIEHRAYGIPFYSAEERAARLAEALEVITRLWSGDRSTWKGEYYELLDAPFSPKPLQRPHPPIVIGGQGKRLIMPIVARYADEWNVPPGVSPEGVRERLSIVRRKCRRLKRSPCIANVSVFLPLVNMTNVPLAGPLTRLGARFVVGKRVASSLLAGSPREIRRRIQEYVDAGATRIIITTRPAQSRRLMRRFAREVMPAFHGPPGHADRRAAGAGPLVTQPRAQSPQRPFLSTRPGKAPVCSPRSLTTTPLTTVAS